MTHFSQSARRVPPVRARRSVLAVVVALALSALLHMVLVLWLQDRLAWPWDQAPRVINNRPVSVVLIAGQAVAGLPVAAATPARAAPRGPVQRKPVPRPAAITVAAASPAGAPGIAPDEVTAVAEEAGVAEAAELLAVDAARESAGNPPGRDARAASENAAGNLAAEPDDAVATPSDPLEQALAERAARTPPVPAPLFGAPLPAPPSGRWQFRVFYGDYTENRPIAVLDYIIEHADGHYRLRTEGRAEGLLSLFYSGVLAQASSGLVTADGLQPERYAERRGSRAERWASVDRARHEITYSGGERAALVDGLQDRLSVLVQLGLMARATPERFAAGASVEFSETSLRDVERSRYASLGDEVLHTDAGALRALHLERVAPRKPGDPVIEVWLGYDRGLIPVRIRISEGSRVLDQVLAR